MTDCRYIGPNDIHNLGDRVILKPLTRWNEAYKEFPRYVMEYLVSRYVQPTDPVAGQEKIDRILTEHYAESAKKELIKSRIKEKGSTRCSASSASDSTRAADHYWADVPALGDNTVRVAPKVLEAVRRRAADQRCMGHDGDRVRRHLRNQGPEVPVLRPRLHAAAIHAAGSRRLHRESGPSFQRTSGSICSCSPLASIRTKFDRRVKMLMLLRLVPFVESNYNLIELGPRETGKTYTFRNTSNRAFVVSGGKATPAISSTTRHTASLASSASSTCLLR